MRRQHRLFVTLLTLLALSQAHGQPAAGQEKMPPPVRIGIVDTLFRDISPEIVFALMKPFELLMKAQTGLDSQLLCGGDPLTLGRQLAEDKVDLGVFHGIEFAWAQQKYPQLRPLMIVYNDRPDLYANVIVRADSGVKAFSDLQGKVLALPRYSREHSYQFLSRLCRQAGSDASNFFAKVKKTATAEDALDDVVDGAVQAALVEEVPWDCYQRRKPGRFAQLKRFQQSQVFPASLVAYHAGHFDEKTLQRFRDGLLDADKNPIGRQLLTLWRLTRFDVVPGDFQERLKKIVKTYPTPDFSRDAERRAQPHAATPGQASAERKDPSPLAASPRPPVAVSRAVVAPSAPSSP